MLELCDLQVEDDRVAWCKARFLSARALKKARDIYKQLEGHLLALKLASQSQTDLGSIARNSATSVDDTSVLKAIAAGLFLHAAVRQEDGAPAPPPCVLPWQKGVASTLFEKAS